MAKNNQNNSVNGSTEQPEATAPEETVQNQNETPNESADAKLPEETPTTGDATSSKDETTESQDSSTEQPEATAPEDQKIYTLGSAGPVSYQPNRAHHSL